ncbi:hypothetical protein G6F50_015898 [Rhizopus delemar]|uniref:Uncharacterized protein n=1 Tax=Rhizopus delemar TaxID=936053 RepID=A0A9P6XVD4_9FUNG|nr:hypothetical protein G6F50_015898 [Rhizopus delemar]
MINVEVSRDKHRFTLVTGDEVFTGNNGHIAALMRYVAYYAQDEQIVLPGALERPLAARGFALQVRADSGATAARGAVRSIMPGVDAPRPGQAGSGRITDQPGFDRAGLHGACQL